MNREELQKVHDALALLNSMVNCGEQHSPTSINMTQAAFAILRKLLPPAEGAEQRIRVRNILQDFYRRGEYELEQAEEDIMRLFQPQPTAEGAEQIASDLSLTIGLLEAEIDSLKDAYKSDGLNSREYSSAILSHKTALKILKGNILQKPLQPTAEGAEEIPPRGWPDLDDDVNDTRLGLDGEETWLP